MRDLMVDLETLGTGVDSVFISIGAVYFDIKTGKVGKELYYNIDWQSSLDAGRKMDADTIKWWLHQSDEARNTVLQEGEQLGQVLWNLIDFLQEEGPAEGVKVWGNGSSFDISMLEHAYDKSAVNCPWKFWNVRDVRTIKDLGEVLVDKSVFKLEGTAHNALDDAKHQAKYVSACYQALIVEK